MVIEHKLKGTAKRSAINVKKQYGQLPLLHCYPGQLNQVFMNILLNAAEALSVGSAETIEDNSPWAPEICITTALVQELAPEVAAEHVCIEIMDNGPGISQAIIGNIFDPFFTTKPVGEGNGLGLSMSYQIVCDRHQGNLLCTSTPGEGTTFRIELPVLGGS